MRVDTRLWLLRAGMVGPPNSPAAAAGRRWEICPGRGADTWVRSLKPRVWSRKASLHPPPAGRDGRLSVLTGRKGPNSRGQELGLVSLGLSLPLSRTSRRRPPPSLPVELGGKLADNFAQSSALLGNPFALPRGRKEYIRGGNFSTYPFICSFTRL